MSGLEIRASSAPRALPATLKLAALGALLVVMGCDRASDRAESTRAVPHSVERAGAEKDAAPGAPMQAADATGSSTAGGQGLPAPLASRVLIKTVDMALRVASVDSTGARIERLVVSRGGFIASRSVQNPDTGPFRMYRLRVPVGEVDHTVHDLRHMAVRVESESQNVEDVSAQVVDFEARLRTLRATEEELRGLLKDARTRGQKAEDIMAVYRELTGIRTQIEQIQGQLQSFKDLAVLSTINVQLIADAATVPIQINGWRPAETFRSSMRQLVGALRGLGDVSIWVIVVLLPIVAILGAIALALRALWRRSPLAGRIRRAKQ